MTPLHLQIMLSAYVSKKPVDNHKSPAAEKFTHELIREGLLESYLVDLEPKVTEKGKHFIQMLTDTPIPVQVFQDPRKRWDQE